MADHAKQSGLNGAYYGPAIPPPAQSYHAYGRRSSGCGPCCLVGLLCKIVVTIVVILGIAALVLWLVFRPNEVKFHVVNASLTRFDITPNNTLRYDLALDVAVRNPNRKIGIYYDSIQANGYYHDIWFGSKWVDPFYQPKKNTTMLKPILSGEIPLGGSIINEFDGEKRSGVFPIDVVVNLRVRLKFGSLKSKRIKPKINCDMKIPLKVNGSVTAFETKRCDVDF
ncbi:hypothetical protein Syun_002466 [Stephania yunnanensis]|uniref:Late embryogenesis abundant protein LEA-2 subgroup domain-containing protein n=1 Tax=Stephania yunnanensis TaxID=152371 RepID=A0AAP0LFT1_9MAGN